MSNGTCENCKWWKEGLGCHPTEGRQGECRALPPVAWKFENWSTPKKAWPETSEGDFCGDFQPKDDRASRLLGSKFMSKGEAA